MFDDFEELAKTAYKREELSDLTPLPVKYIHQKLFILYDDFSKGKYTKDKCISIKNQYRNEYKNLIKQQEQDTELYREYCKNRRENAELLIKLEKSFDKEEMLDICLKIVGNCLGDKSLYERNIRKGEQLDFTKML